MKSKFSLLTATIVMLLHWCSASARPETLPRPSPINPDIPMDPKPVETISLITDPKEIAKIKREIHDETKDKITAPTLPPKQDHPFQQPAPGQHQERETLKSSSTKTPSISGTLDYKQESEHTTTVDSKGTGETRPTSSTIASSTPPKGAPVSAAPQTKYRHTREERKDANVVPLYNREQHLSIKPKTSPIIIVQTGLKEKRDIPVPLVPKHHHPEESPKMTDKDDQNSTVAAETSAGISETHKNK